MSLVSTFDLVIEKSGASYEVRVRSEGQDEPEARISARKVRGALRDRFASLIERIDQGVLTPGLQAQTELSSLGEWLFAMFFVGEVGEAWKSFVSSKKKIRLRLTFRKAAELSKLPWEALCSRQGFLALHEDIAVVRSLERVSPCREVQFQSRVHLRFVEGPGSEDSPLTTDDEFAALEKAVAAKGRKCEIRVYRSRKSPAAAAADREIEPVHVLHFAGHGVFKAGGGAYSIVYGRDGVARAQLSQDWATDLHRQKDLQLVVLNSCEGARHTPLSVSTSLAHAIVRTGVPAVVAMQFRISNDAAVAFTRGFYRALAESCDVAMAVTRARQEIRSESPEEWLSPVLYLCGKEERIPWWRKVWRWIKSHRSESVVILLAAFALVGAMVKREDIVERYWRAVRESRISSKDWLTPEPPGVAGWKCPTLADTGIELVLIPAAEFRMGSDSGELEEQPAHWVKLTQPYCLGKTEVAQVHWSRVMGDNPSEEKGPDLPVTNVSWDRTAEFFARLRSRAPDAACSLPSEAEFEYAAGAGQGYVYGVPREAELTDLGNFLGPRDGYLGPAPVKEFPPNDWGLFGMLGNVGEWVIDRAGRYPSTLAIDPTGPKRSAPGEEDHRVRRGGSFENTPDNARSTSRVAGPDRKMNHVGFRVVCAPVPD